MTKTFLFIGYWSANDGLTKSTILPHLEILANLESVKEILFVSLEREDEKVFSIDVPKVKHIPLYTKDIGIPLVNKFLEVSHFVSEITSITQKSKITHIIARGACAGALAYKVHKKTNVPYFVESYEPHAWYMLESKVWKRWDPRYFFQERWEKKQKMTATALMPVSHHYKQKLIDEGVEGSKIDVIPCCVNLEKFKFSDSQRIQIRNELNIDSETFVGIYVGKFGGLYYEGQAFELFYKVLSRYKKFHMLILSPQDEGSIQPNLLQAGFDKEACSILSVTHDHVSAYLSCSDLAFATYKKGDSKKFLSPVKVGEYWANGLPVILTKGIGDDSDIIELNQIGQVFDLGEEIDFTFLKNIDRSSSVQLAKKHRSFDIVRQVYSKWYK